jgi:hypothetical protein
MLTLQFLAIQEGVSWEPRTNWPSVLVAVFVVLGIVALLVFVSRNRTKA